MHAKKYHSLLLEKRTVDAHGSDIPLLIVDRLLNSFIHGSSSRLHSLSSHFYYYYFPPKFALHPICYPSSLHPSSFSLGYLWKANHFNGLFPLPIFAKKKDKNMLITNFTRYKKIKCLLKSLERI